MCVVYVCDYVSTITGNAWSNFNYTWYTYDLHSVSYCEVRGGDVKMIENEQYYY